MVEVMPLKVLDCASIEPEKLSVSASRMIRAASWPAIFPLEIMLYTVP